MPIDEARYKKLVKENAGLVYAICMGFGFEGAELDEMVQEVWLNLWKARASKLDTESDVAYLAGVARMTCKMELRAGKRRKRFALAEYGFNERDTGELSSGTVNGAVAFKSAEQERVCDQKALRANLVELAGMLRPSQENMILERLNSGGDLSSDSRAARTQMGALRHSRRILNLPVVDPQGGEVDEPRSAPRPRRARPPRARAAGDQAHEFEAEGDVMRARRAPEVSAPRERADRGEHLGDDREQPGVVEREPQHAPAPRPESRRRAPRPSPRRDRRRRRAPPTVPAPWMGTRTPEQIASPRGTTRLPGSPSSSRDPRDADTEVLPAGAMIEAWARANRAVYPVETKRARRRPRRRSPPRADRRARRRSAVDRSPTARSSPSRIAPSGSRPSSPSARRSSCATRSRARSPTTASAPRRTCSPPSRSRSRRRRSSDPPASTTGPPISMFG